MKFESMGGVAEMEPPKKEKRGTKYEAPELKKELRENINKTSELIGALKKMSREQLSEMSDEELLKLNEKLDELLKQQRQIMNMPKSQPLPKTSKELEREQDENDGVEKKAA